MYDFGKRERDWKRSETGFAVQFYCGKATVNAAMIYEKKLRAIKGEISKLGLCSGPWHFQKDTNYKKQLNLLFGSWAISFNSTPQRLHHMETKLILRFDKEVTCPAQCVMEQEQHGTEREESVTSFLPPLPLLRYCSLNYPHSPFHLLTSLLNWFLLPQYVNLWTSKPYLYKACFNQATTP